MMKQYYEMLIKVLKFLRDKVYYRKTKVEFAVFVLLVLQWFILVVLKHCKMKKLGISIAELSALIIIYGLLKEILYYNYFGISITQFITLSEIGMLISEDLLIIIPLCSVFIISWVWLVKSAEKDWDERRPKKFALHPINFSYQLSLYLFLSIFVYSFIFGRIYPNSVIIYSIVTVVIMAVVIFYRKFEILKENSTLLTLVLVVLFVTDSLIYSTAYQLKNTFKGKHRNTTLITKDSSIYISNDTCVYIGKTENYIFFYSIMTKSTDIIPVSEIKSFRMHTLTHREMKNNNVVR